jgi:hypothetical protein
MKCEQELENAIPELAEEAPIPLSRAERARLFAQTYDSEVKEMEKFDEEVRAWMRSYARTLSPGHKRTRLLRDMDRSFSQALADGSARHSPDRFHHACSELVDGVRLAANRVTGLTKGYKVELLAAKAPALKSLIPLKPTCLADWFTKLSAWERRYPLGNEMDEPPAFCEDYIEQNTSSALDRLRERSLRRPPGPRSAHPRP